MSSGDGQDINNTANSRRAGESTDYHGAPHPGASGSGFHDRAEIYNKSMRIHGRNARGGLALRLALPIVIVMLVGLVLFSLFAHKRVHYIQLADIKSDALNVVYSNALLGRLIITHRDKFIQDNPDYIQKAEWLTGDHWLVTHGFVSPEDWVDATGFQLDEYAPTSVMDKAGEQTILAGMSRYLNSTRADTEIIGAYLNNADGTVIASSQKVNYRFDARAVKAIPLPDEQLNIGGCRLYVNYITDLPPEPMVRAIAFIMRDDELDDQPLGSATVILRTRRHMQDLNSFLLLLLGITVGLTTLLAVVTWLSARRITDPMRRLAGQMQQIAEGIYDGPPADFRKNDEMGMLGQAFNSMVQRLRVANLNAKENSRLESDLAIARDIQNNLLPLQTPRVHGLDVYTSYRPAKEIGGDYFDFLPVDDRHMGMVIADASGKSIPAALVMSTTRAVLRFVAPGTLSAAETLTRVNAILSVDIPKGMFVTAYYLILDPLDRSMICASAGHTPLLISKSDGSVELMNPGGIALGFDPGPIFQRSIREKTVKLSSGDRVLMYTDGVVECVNPANEEYSDRRLREFLRRNRDLSSHDFVGALIADLDRHRGSAEMRDDTTIVTFKVL